ncbi:MAG: MOSC domain-containing protein [Paracoccaceae bacterium]|nr:MOSC domain-containing protein [Paracoccaceae bacterium]
MITLTELQGRFAAPGRVEAVWLRRARNAPMVQVESVAVSDSGLDGDRARAGKRAVSLIQAEHLPVIAALAGLEVIDPSVLRRNIVVSGLNLGAFRGKALQVGTVVLELTVPCHPCSKMEAVLGHGAYTAMRGHGGMCASVKVPGRIASGDTVLPFLG